MIISKILIAQGYKIPFWYGCAYYNWESYTMVAYPLGINFIVRWFRLFYLWLQKDKPDWIDKLLKEEKQKSYDLGFQAGMKIAIETKEKEEF